MTGFRAYQACEVFGAPFILGPLLLEMLGSVPQALLEVSV